MSFKPLSLAVSPSQVRAIRSSGSSPCSVLYEEINRVHSKKLLSTFTIHRDWCRVHRHNNILNYIIKCQFSSFGKNQCCKKLSPECVQGSSPLSGVEATLLCHSSVCSDWRLGNTWQLCWGGILSSGFPCANVLMHALHTEPIKLKLKNGNMQI